MKQYYVEGLYINRSALKRANRRGHIAQADIEPFAKTFWADSPAQAERMATEALEGGQWTEGPRVGANSEEQRMRAMGAPELPGFSAAPKKSRTKKRK